MEKSNNREMVTNKDLQIIYGFSYHEAKKIIHRTKLKLVKHGRDYYANKRVGKVPHKWVREDLGLEEQ